MIRLTPRHQFRVREDDRSQQGQGKPETRRAGAIRTADVAAGRGGTDRRYDAAARSFSEAEQLGRSTPFWQANGSESQVVTRGLSVNAGQHGQSAPPAPAATPPMLVSPAFVNDYSGQAFGTTPEQVPANRGNAGQAQAAGRSMVCRRRSRAGSGAADGSGRRIPPPSPEGAAAQLRISPASITTPTRAPNQGAQPFDLNQVVRKEPCAGSGRGPFAARMRRCEGD